jgi:hypothetical protein
MREIKFRMWDDDNEEMRSWDEIKDDRLPQSPSLILMQYTGLCDKNGVEIYEKDVCLIEGKNYSYPFLVEWDEQTAGFSLKWLDVEADWLDWNEVVVDKLHLVKVIGNIYENKELLK